MHLPCCLPLGAPPDPEDSDSRIASVKTRLPHDNLIKGHLYLGRGPRPSLRWAIEQYGRDKETQRHV
jgi:hypothetical protein